MQGSLKVEERGRRIRVREGDVIMEAVSNRCNKRKIYWLFLALKVELIHEPRKAVPLEAETGKEMESPSRTP